MRLPFLDPKAMYDGPFVLGLTGPARSGKDSVADIFIDRTEEHTARAAFADILKLSAARSLGEDIHTVEEAREWSDRFKVEGKLTCATRSN